MNDHQYRRAYGEGYRHGWAAGSLAMFTGGFVMGVGFSLAVVGYLWLLAP